MQIWRHTPYGTVSLTRALFLFATLCLLITAVTACESTPRVITSIVPSVNPPQFLKSSLPDQEWIYGIWHPSSRYIASVHEDGVLMIWSVADGQILHRLEKLSGFGFGYLSWSPDGRTLGLLTKEGEVMLVDAETGVLVETQMLEEPAISIQFGSKYNLFYIVGELSNKQKRRKNQNLFNLLAHSSQVWDTEHLTARYALPQHFVGLGFSLGGAVFGGSEWRWPLESSWTPDGETLVSIDKDSLYLWHATDGSLHRSIPLETLGSPGQILINRDASMALFTQKMDLVGFSLETNKVKYVMFCKRGIASRDGEHVVCIAEPKSCRGKPDSCGRDERLSAIRIRIENGTDIAEIPNCDEHPVASSTNGERFITLDDNELFVWDFAKGRKTVEFKVKYEIKFAIFSPDDSKILAWDSKENVYIIDAQSGILIHSIAGPDVRPQQLKD